MPYRVDLTPRAERELAEVYELINAEDSPKAALWFNGLERLVCLLETIPYLGFRSHESPYIRQLIYGKKPHFYRVLYRVIEVEQTVTVLHIRHGRRGPFEPEDVQS